MSNDFLDLSKVPVGLSPTSRDCAILINALAGTIYPEDRDRARVLMAHIRNCMEASMRMHREAGVPPVDPPARHLHEIEAVLAPVRSLRVLGHIA